ncbi:Fe-S cluster assembly protein SufD [Indioceanicola profundi]|uniref:Fe-S cluster assembly protein SufD n=1 Tax=Indioceanicola profundi TaxID=2220096 RepID=UPI000E6AD63B|nr:Fe-S cluster assembly protein SufD [Indioceanicola profundi]
MTNETTQTPAPVQAYLDQYKAALGSLPGTGLPWLTELRAAGIDRFAKTGFPTQRNEAYRFTSLRALERQNFAVAPRGGAAVVPEQVPVVVEGSHRLVFVNGRFDAALSSIGNLPQGVVLESMAAALTGNPELVAENLGRTATLDGHPLLALNMAFLGDGVVLRIPRGTVVREPVELTFLAAEGAEGQSWHPRILVLAEQNCEATLVEQHLSLAGGRYFANVAAEIVVGSGARIRHYKHQGEGPDAIHMATVTTRIARDATYDSFTLNTGSILCRHEARTLLDDVNGSCHVSGAYAVRGKQHTDFTSFIDHVKPHCTSRQVVKGAIDDEARAVFQGKIVVRPDAQKTDGYQLNRALLLSDRAEINAKPELEIYADDVKCSHGATAGELDDAQLFYLRARGIPLEQARGLLIAAFLDEAMEEIADETVRAVLQSRVHAWLGAR